MHNKKTTSDKIIKKQKTITKEEPITEPLGNYYERGNVWSGENPLQNSLRRKYQPSLRYPPSLSPLPPAPPFPFPFLETTEGPEGQGHILV